jgi:hypothetical protein
LINGGRQHDPKARRNPKRKAQDKKTDDPWATLLPPSFNASLAAKEAVQTMDERRKEKSTSGPEYRGPSIRYVNLPERYLKRGSGLQC